MASDQHEAEVLLQVENATLLEVRGQQKLPVLRGVELLVISIVPTPQEVLIAEQQLQLAPGTLKADNNRPLVFILCGEYKIPICATIPAIQESPLDFVFAVPNLWMGVSLPPNTDPDVVEALEMLIKTYGILRQKPGARPPPPASAAPTEQSRAAPALAAGAVTAVALTSPGNPPLGPAGEEKLSTRVANGIVGITRFAVSGIRKGTQMATAGIGHGSDKAVEHLTPTEQPVHVPIEYRQKLQGARVVTKSAVMMSGGIAAALVGVSAVLGGGAAGIIGRVAPRSGDPKFDGVKEVGGAGVGGIAMIISEATDAARVLLTAGADGVSKIVTHKFGAEVGETTSEGLGLLTDAVTVQQNVRNVGFKALARRTAQTLGSNLADMDTPPPPPPALH